MHQMTQYIYLKINTSNICYTTTLDKANPISTPMTSINKRTKQGDDFMSNLSLYRYVVEALQFATVTRPETSFSVNKVC